MKRMCRQLVTPSWRRRQLIWQEFFPHARIVTDVKKMAQLNADVAKRKRKEESDRKTAGRVEQGSARGHNRTWID
jgi:hypothetical protein